MRPIIFFLAIIFTAEFARAQEYYLLTGTYNTDDSAGIYVYRFNSSTGEIQPSGTTVTDNPSYLAVSGDNRYLYAVNENGNGNGGVSAFSFDAATGGLTLINRQSSQGDHPCYIAIDRSGKWVVAGNYTGGNFSVFPIAGDGGVGKAAQVIQHTGGSVNPERQEKPHVHCAVFAPDGKRLVICDLGKDKLMTYPFNAKKEAPVVNKPYENSTDPGSGPRHIVFHPGKKYAYVIGELSGYITAYAYREDKLHHLQSVNSHPEDYTGEKGSAAIRVSPDGRFVYASNRGSSNTISIFEIDQSTGKLTGKGFVKTGGEGPRDFVIDPTGEYLLCSNAASNEIRIFKRSRITGLLEDTGKQVAVNSPVNMLFIPVKSKKN